MSGIDSQASRIPAKEWGFGLIAAGLWALGLWAAGLHSILGRWDGVLLTLCGLPLIALLLDLDRPLSRRSRDVCALLAPQGMLWVLNHRALGFWWVGDDPCHLAQILDYGIWRPFIEWVGYFLTPLLHFSLGVDLRLFGLEPRAFYAHQLVSFTVLLGIGYAFLRSYLKPAFVSLALALFVSSSPAIAVAQQQMNRHYLEGLLLMLASFVLYRRSLTCGRYWLAIFGAGLYLLATAAKEVFVPMALVLPFLAAGAARPDVPRAKNTGAWWRHGIPYVVALGFYGLWRLYMLGWDNNLSAYGALSGQYDGGALLRRIPRLAGLVEPWQVIVVGALVVAAAWTLSRRSKLFAGGLGVTLVVLVLPLVAVPGRLEPRHLFVAALAASAMVAAALHSCTAGRDPTPCGDAWRVRLRTLSGIALVPLGLYALTVSPLWTTLEKTSRAYRAEGGFLLDASRDGMLLTEVQHSHHLECLARLRHEILGQTAGPGFCGDLCYCSQAFPEEVFWRAADGDIVAVTERGGAGCDSGRRLQIDIRHDRRQARLSWDLGPYEDGTYQALLFSHVDRPGVSIPLSIPRRGSMPFRLKEPLRFVLKYRSPEGWQTYSPVQVVEPGGRAQSAEERSGDECDDL